MEEVSDDWFPFQTGATLGKRGSENGVILRDEEQPYLARMTLEQGGDIAPFAITCGVYYLLIHTCFFSSQKEAEEAFSRMKEDLNRILQDIPLEDDPVVRTAKMEPIYERLSAFTEKY